jgi:ParB family chromosome partitioning protein
LEALLGRAPGAAGGSSPLAKTRPFETPYGGATEEPYSPDEAILRAATPVAAPPAPPEPAPPAGPPSKLSLDQIDHNPFQPRQDFDPAEIEELAGSLRNHGLLQPIVVRQIDDRYQLIAGERRLRAATQAGWTEVPVQIVEADDREVAELAIIENVHRKDLNPLEKAASFHRYLQEYGCTQEELANRLNLDRSTVANLIRLLELPDTIQDAVRQNKITQGHARALLPLGDEREQLNFCRRIQQEGMSVRQTEAMVQETIDQTDTEPLNLVGRDGQRRAARTNEHIVALEQEFRSALGLKVKLTHNARGRGKLVIHFGGHDDFERLRQHICGPVGPDAQSYAS